MQVDPAVEEYDPFAQGVHDDAPADDDDPAGHFVHIDAPNVAAYVPAEQGVQIPKAYLSVSNIGTFFM